MKSQLVFLWLLLLSATACSAQSEKAAVAQGEFQVAPNGLIYSPQTMGQLRRIVDSLNLKHRVCELRRTYQSKRQGQAHYVRLEKGNLKAARQALEQGIAFEAFVARFPATHVERDLLVVCYEDTDEDDGKRKTTTQYASIPFNNQDEYIVRVDGPAKGPALGPGRWIVESRTKSEYSDAYVEAFYLVAGLAQAPLPAQYANLVQYADCLIDTTTQIHFESAKRTGRTYRVTQPRAQEAFMQYAHQQTGRPSVGYDEKETDAQQEARWRAYREWDSLRLEKMDQLAKSPKFKQLLTQAATAASSQGATDEEFEEYVARYYSPKKALDFKRSRIVVGGCSQDDSPRRHALSIAQLSAQTVNWETFLRAHLDIMNDRFERVSDGSYAFAARQTYLRELEELDINVSDLMLGISLRLDNPSRNHYFGNVGRLGRALAESQQPREVEQRLLGLVADTGLDTYNRVLAYYLFLNYNHHLEDKPTQQQNVAKLNAAVEKLPAYLVARALVKDKK